MFFESRFFAIDSINTTLSLYSSPKIKKFCIQLQDNVLETMRCPMDSWISVAMQRKVEDFTLDWDEFGEIVEVGDFKGYVLPEYVYQNSHLVRFKINLCDFNPKGRILWTSMKELSIGYASMSDELIQNILDGTPVLHSLKLFGCSAIFNLDLSRNTHLKILVIDDHYTSAEEDFPLKIVGPYIEELEIMGYWSDDDFILKNMSRLVRVTLELRQGTPDNEEEEDFAERWHITMKGLLENVYHAEYLKLGDWCVQVLSTMTNYRPSLSTTRKCMTINICLLDEECLTGIASLLHSSPKLEELVINFSPSHNTVEFCGGLKSFLFSDIGLNYWRSQRETYNSLEFHLKKVEISGLANDTCNAYIFEFLKFLLRNAKVLEMLIIHNFSRRSKNVLKMANKLVRMPKCSPNCHVLLPYDDDDDDDDDVCHC
ncbi:F-box/RNI-like superfamily protein [Euphorbia peplus]|nr:F-box/RNI-like superfamily protein [Euphorbia peplus]